MAGVRIGFLITCSGAGRAGSLGGAGSSGAVAGVSAAIGAGAGRAGNSVGGGKGGNGGKSGGGKGGKGGNGTAGGGKAAVSIVGRRFVGAAGTRSLIGFSCSLLFSKRSKSASMFSRFAGTFSM